MERFLTLNFELIKIINTCKIHINTFDFPRVIYAIDDLYTNHFQLLKYAKLYYKKLTFNQIEHVNFLMKNICNEAKSILVFLEQHSMYQEYNKLEMCCLALQSII